MERLAAMVRTSNPTEANASGHVISFAVVGANLPQPLDKSERRFQFGKMGGACGVSSFPLTTVTPDRSERSIGQLVGHEKTNLSLAEQDDDGSFSLKFRRVQARHRTLEPRTIGKFEAECAALWAFRLQPSANIAQNIRA